MQLVDQTDYFEMKKQLFSFILMGFIAFGVNANEAIYQKSADMSLDEAHTSIYQELEQRNLFVVFEANIGKNISRFEKKWGEQYNQNQLGGIKSLVFCNGWYANQVSNKDPAMLALCPMRLSVIERSGKAHILFVKPTAIAKDSPAFETLREIEGTVIEAINSAME